MKNSTGRIIFIITVAVLMIAGSVFLYLKNQSKKSDLAINAIPMMEGTQDMSVYFNSEEFKNYYGTPATPPPFDFNVDISHKTYPELQILENEIYARHHYLFEDAVMRGHFNQFKWYQPIFWKEDYKISITGEEKAFVQKVSALEDELLKKNYIERDGKKLANMDNVVNFSQFKNIPDVLKSHLATDGFAINETKNMQLFNTYETNNYEAIPSFVTSDVYLQLLHIHFSNMMRNLEEHHYIPVVKSLTKGLYEQNLPLCNNADPVVKEAATFNTCFYALAYSLVSGEKVAVPAGIKKMYLEEMAKLKAEFGRNSRLLNDPLFDYSQLKPRGYYTRSNDLKRYFSCMKWLMTAPIYLEDNQRLSAAMISAQLIATRSANNQPLLKIFNSVNETFNFLVGEPDNLSYADIIKLISEKGLTNTPVNDLVSKTNVQAFRTILQSRNPERIHAHGGNDFAKDQFAKAAIYFMPGRYTFDAEILQRLIHVLRPTPKRTFPKGLDIFATFGNKTAEDILINTYHETQKWPQYADTLKTLQNQFASYNRWDRNAYSKSMECIMTLQKKDSKQPYYMQLPAWDKKTLNTSLGYWSELKHDVILYAKQPDAAEMGGGELDPPPPVYPGYVEPDIDFWKNCIALLDLTSQGLEKNGVAGEDYKRNNEEMKTMAGFFLKTSEKEIKGENLTKSDFDSILDIGGSIERLTQSILGDDRQLGDENNPDRYAGCIADVYTYNDSLIGYCLEEGTSWGNEIYVVAEINGRLYLTKGAVFSYREFKQSSDNRLTDEDWHKMMEAKEVPAAPEWMNSITAPFPALETKAWYSNSAVPTAMKGF